MSPLNDDQNMAYCKVVFTAGKDNERNKRKTKGKVRFHKFEKKSVVRSLPAASSDGPQCS